jgi:hypothetical protein
MSDKSPCRSPGNSPAEVVRELMAFAIDCAAAQAEPKAEGAQPPSPEQLERIHALAEALPPSAEEDSWWEGLEEEAAILDTLLPLAEEIVRQRADSAADERPEKQL